jgi:BRO family, N-domain protein
MNNIVQFNDHNIQIIERTNQLWLSSGDIALALGYEKTKSITNLYNNHKEEFDGMSEVIDSVTSNSMSRRQRIFNREGAWLIGMFARTPKAAEFRKWVLKVLGAVVDGQQVDKPVIVSEHTRALPSGKKEIVLSAKAREEIGGIVKKCTAVAVREELESRDQIRAENIDLKNRLRQVQLWANGIKL